MHRTHKPPPRALPRGESAVRTCIWVWSSRCRQVCFLYRRTGAIRRAGRLGFGYRPEWLGPVRGAMIRITRGSRNRSRPPDIPRRPILIVTVRP